MAQGKEKTEQAKTVKRDQRVFDRAVKDAISPVARDNPSPAKRAGKDERRDDDDK